jgi:peptidoglycan/LPS O-acetylase OafA/YrhL
MSAEPVPAAPPKLQFRPDVQGIRALAVLLVIVNHIAPGLLPGGYVGVDVFFVVSGYLITTLLLGEAGRSSRISLPGFYARRARRIIPAATVVTIATVVASLLTLPLLRVQTILTDAVWATFFAANVRMADVGTDYFAQGQPPSPLRHYWSLSVEEQFYLVWPLLLVVCLLLLHRRGHRSVHDFRRTAGLLIVVISVVSLVWSVWATYHSPVTAYFSSLTRAWELGVGAACALLARRSGLPRRVRETLAAVGLAAIAVATLLYSEATPFPGAYALLPVLGTAALVAAGEGNAPTTVGRVLSVRPAVLVGDWSYSLYLWHWPVIVLLRAHLGPVRFDSVPVRLATLVLVFALSYASYRWVETPFRHGGWRRRSRALLIYPVAIAMVVATVLVSTQVVRYQLGEFSNDPPISTADYSRKKLGQDPYVALVRASALAAEQGRTVPSDLTPGLVHLREQTASLGDCDYRTGTTDLCPIGDDGGERSIVVLGDSHARALSPAVAKIGEDLGYRVYVLVYSGCSANSAVQVDATTGRAWDSCEEFKQWADDTIASLHPDLLVVSTSAGRVIDPDTGDVLTGARGFEHYLSVLEGGWQDLFEGLRSSADRVYVVGNTPKLPRETGVCLSQGDPDLGDCAFAPGPRAVSEARASFRAARTAGIGTVDAMEWFCVDQVCPSVVGKYITMRDSEHMTPDYARWLSTPLAAALGLTEPVGAATANGRQTGSPEG